MIKKLKRITPFLIIFLLIIALSCLTPSAETVTSTNKIDWTKPVSVKIVGYKDVNTITVEYSDLKFDVSFFGVDVVESYKKTGSYDLSKEYYTRLLRNNTITLEIDDKNNMYNRENEVQAWIWSSDKLFQLQLITDGYAQIDDDICKYSNCKKYYDLLKEKEQTAKTELSGMWGAQDVVLVKTMGGVKSTMIKLLGIEMPIIAIAIIATGVTFLIIGIIMVILGKKHNKKTVKVECETEKTKEMVNIEGKTDTDDKEIIKERVIEAETKEDFKKELISRKSTYDSEFKDFDMKNKTILLNVVSNMFNPKDVRSKGLLETIKVELNIIDENLKSEEYEWFVKPMKNPKLTNYCKERVDITQININNGLLFEETLLNILPLLEKCDNIYSWGKSTLIQLLKEGKEKLTEEDYNILENNLTSKYINYKEDFSSRNEITPCSLTKAADLCGLKQEQKAVNTMTNIYKIERM